MESIAFDRGLEIHDVLDKVEIAIAVACRDTEYKGEIKMECDFERRELKYMIIVMLLKN